jgi:TPR repeat protein
MSQAGDFALVPRPSDALQKAEPGAKRVIAKIVADVLAMAAVEDGEALFQKGCAYHDGKGVVCDCGEAARWFIKASERGHVGAQVNLGWCFLEGCGMGRDYEQAVHWLREAAAQRRADAQNILGACYERGLGVPGNLEEAAHWYGVAAAQGYALAHKNLGRCHEHGLGVPKNLDRAFHHYRLAFVRGTGGLAANEFGLCFLHGRGVPKEYERTASEHAADCFQHGAEIGQDKACQFNLGVCYLYGAGVQKNPAEAYMWFKLAAEQGQSEARAQLAALFSSMSAAEVMEGERAYKVYFKHRAQCQWPGHPAVTDVTYEQYTRRKLP